MRRYLKRFWLRILFFLFAMVILVNLIYLTYQKNEKKSNTEILFLDSLIDIGKIARNGNAEATFKIVNESANNLRILKVIPDCHCTSIFWTKTSVPMGDTASIKVKYDTNIIGFFQKKIYVEYNSLKSPKLLIIQGEVY